MTTIRPARLSEDKPAILGFIDGLQAFEQAFEPNRRVDATVAEAYFARLSREAATRPTAAFIAEEAKQAVGWALAYETEDDVYVVEAERRIAYIAELFVAEAARGRGAGRALIAACEEWARARGIGIVLIGVLPGNARAHATYGKAGYGTYSLQLRKRLG